VGSMKVWRY